jgi:hypothetical protein
MFKPIKDFENYMVNENGTIINNQTNQVKVPTSNNAGKGYMYVELWKNNQRKRMYVHRIVAEAFIPNTENKPYINHKDGNPKNNNVENLEWCTPLENVEHASKVLGVMQQYKKANAKRQRAVRQIDVATQQVVAIYPSMGEAERKTGIKSSYISQICSGKFKQCFGYSWCYVEEKE